MKDYQERVVQELADLNVKITKLETFIAGTCLNEGFKEIVLDPKDWTLLIVQRDAMRLYASLLEQRIERFI